MKTHQEIIEFINSREVLTRNELEQFIYGYHRSNEKLARYWDYVLRTKDAKKLREYQQEKIKGIDKEKFERYKNIYLNDERIRTCGTKIAYKILQNVYNFKLSRVTIQSYKKLCEQAKQQ